MSWNDLSGQVRSGQLFLCPLSSFAFATLGAIECDPYRYFAETFSECVIGGSYPIIPLLSSACVLSSKRGPFQSAFLPASHGALRTNSVCLVVYFARSTPITTRIVSLVASAFFCVLSSCRYFPPLRSSTKQVPRHAPSSLRLSPAPLLPRSSSAVVRFSCSRLRACSHPVCF